MSTTATAERLQAYYPFDEEIIASVSEVAGRLARYKTYGEFIAGTKTPEPFTLEFDAHKPIRVLDIKPDNCDSSSAIFLHMAMGVGLDNGHVEEISTIAATQPNRRVVAFGNASSFGVRTGKLNRHQMAGAWKSDYETATETISMFAEKERITTADHVGGSFGAELATGASKHGAYAVNNLVAMEGVAVVRRGPIEIIGDFLSTGKTLDDYISRNQLPSLNDARGKDAWIRYGLGLFRASNIANVNGLRDGEFGKRVANAMYAQPNMRATIAWSDTSEMAIDLYTSAIVKQLLHNFGPERTQSVRLEGQKHPWGNDLFLQAAVIATGLRRPLR